MSTIELWRYIGHLAENEQAAQTQEIQFWSRALYPFVCLVMVGLASLAFSLARSVGASLAWSAFGTVVAAALALCSTAHATL